LKYGQEVQNSDPQRNIVFSVHMYVLYAYGGYDVGSKLGEIQWRNLTVIVGEFALKHPDYCNKWYDINIWEIMR
jgi:mannan endo-1,4-beta-mannosidase